MTDSVIQKRLRPGLDPNGGFAAVLGYAETWNAAEGHGAAWNPRRRGLELAPRARPEIAQDWLPLAPVEGSDGTLYRTDPETGRVLWRRACDPDYTPLPGTGGEGPATGQFRAPAGLALDGKGRLYVADAGNARIQILDPKKGVVIATLTQGLVVPTHSVIAADGTVYVCEAGTGRIHVFSDRFQPCAVLELATSDPATGAPWVAPPRPRPLAIALLDDCTLAMFDPLRPMLWHMTRTGAALPAIGWFDEPDLPPGWLPTQRRFDGSADLVVGPIDGGIYDLAWHKVEIDAELPAGTLLDIQTFASNDEDATLRAWAPERPLTVTGKAGGSERLILSDQTLWRFWRLGRTVRAQPEIAALDGDGPSNSDLLHLPLSAARLVRPGDRLLLANRPGDETFAEVESVGAAEWTVAATGEAAPPPHLAAEPVSVGLIARDAEPLPYGPVDLGFLGVLPDEADLAAARRDGRRTNLRLPAELAAVVAPGDVIEMTAGGAAYARIELISPAEDDRITITLKLKVAGDYSACTVRLDSTPGRIALREALPLTGPFPPGAGLTLIAGEKTQRAKPSWSDAATGIIWLAEVPPDIVNRPKDRPEEIVPWAEAWTNTVFPEPDATERGRYLWLRLKMAGRGLPAPGRIGPPVVASATPLVKRLRIIAPRYTLLTWLPPLFAKQDIEAEPPGANFMERFLTLFEGHFSRVEAAFDSVSRLLNPRAADRDWLHFVAGWLDLAFDPSWPIDRRRQLVIEGADIQAARGTPRALRRYLEIYTGHPVGITEDFQARPPEAIQLGARGALGIAPLGGADLAGKLAHRFRVTVTLPGHSDRKTQTSAVRGIIDSMKPAHTDYVLDTDGARAPKIGMGTAIGTITIPGPGRTPPCTCDPEAPPSDRPQPGNLARGGFRLGGRLGSGPVTDYRPQGG